MSYQTIKAPEGAMFLKEIPEFSQDLPDNIYLDKVTTGSGFTTCVLTNDVNYVLAVPFQALGDNKLLQSKVDPQYKHELFLYHSGIPQVNNKLYEYLDRNKDKVKKIMITYDSLPKLKTFISPSDYKLAIDEGHKLLEYAGNFKPRVINNLFNELPNYKAFIVATATPTREEYIPVQLTDTPKFRVEWSDVVPVSITSLHLSQNQLFEKVISVALNYKRGTSVGNAYIFYNTVTDIVKVVKVLAHKFGMTPEDVKIICANTGDNAKLVKSVGEGWHPKPVIEEGAVDKYYPVNFITSTAFEGQDFMDPDGVTYIVSDGKLEHTKLDISTQISQIVGRLRVSKYKNVANILWTASPTKGIMSEEEYETWLGTELEEAAEYVKVFDSAKNARTAQEALINGAATKPYFIDDSDEEGLKLILNPNAKNHLMNNFVGIGLQYFVSVNPSTKELSKEGLEAVKEDFLVSLREVFGGKVENTLVIPDLAPSDKKKFRKKVNFAEATREYFKARRHLDMHKDSLIPGEKEVLETIVINFETSEEYTPVLDYIKFFGFDESLVDLSNSSLTYAKITERVAKKRQTDFVKDYLQNTFKEGEVVLNTDLKALLENFYKRYQLLGKPKLTDLGEAFKVIATSVKIDGKKHNAFKILEKA